MANGHLKSAGRDELSEKAEGIAAIDCAWMLGSKGSTAAVESTVDKHVGTVRGDWLVTEVRCMELLEENVTGG